MEISSSNDILKAESSLIVEKFHYASRRFRDAPNEISVISDQLAWHHSYGLKSSSTMESHGTHVLEVDPNVSESQWDDASVGCLNGSEAGKMENNLPAFRKEMGIIQIDQHRRDAWPAKARVWRPIRVFREVRQRNGHLGGLASPVAETKFRRKSAKNPKDSRSRRESPIHGTPGGRVPALVGLLTGDRLAELGNTLADKWVDNVDGLRQRQLSLVTGRSGTMLDIPLTLQYRSLLNQYSSKDSNRLESSEFRTIKQLVMPQGEVDETGGAMSFSPIKTEFNSLDGVLSQAATLSTCDVLQPACSLQDTSEILPTATETPREPSLTVRDSLSEDSCSPNALDHPVIPGKLFITAVARAVINRWQQPQTPARRVVSSPSMRSHASSQLTSGNGSQGTSTARKSNARMETTKRHRSNSDDEDTEQDEKSNRRRGGRRNPPDDSTVDARLLRCPFNVFDPQKYSERNMNRLETRYRRCFSGLLTTIPRLKQHLYRVHQRPQHYCPRCFEVCTSEESLVEHARQSCQCLVSDCPFDDRMTDAQVTEIRHRDWGKSIEDKWYIIFDILFPNTVHPSTPYADDVLNDNFENFLAFVRRRAPLLITARMLNAGFSYPEVRQLTGSHIIEETIGQIMNDYNSGEALYYNASIRTQGDQRVGGWGQEYNLHTATETRTKNVNSDNYSSAPSQLPPPSDDGFTKGFQFNRQTTVQPHDYHQIRLQKRPLEFAPPDASLAGKHLSRFSNASNQAAQSAPSLYQPYDAHRAMSHQATPSHTIASTDHLGLDTCGHDMLHAGDPPQTITCLDGPFPTYDTTDNKQRIGDQSISISMPGGMEPVPQFFFHHDMMSDSFFGFDSEKSGAGDVPSLIWNEAVAHMEPGYMQEGPS